MIIPYTAGGRRRLFERLMEECFVSRDERRSRYDQWRHFFLFGDSAKRARFNKLRSHIEDVASLLFAAEAVRFGLSWGARAERGPDWMLETASQALETVWHEDGMGLTFSEALPWAFNYGTMLLSPQWRSGGLTLYQIQPWNFGVSNEKITRLDHQEAVAVSYNISVPEFIRLVDKAGRGADLQKIMRRVSIGPPQTEDVSSEEAPVVLSSTAGSPNYTGAVNTDLGYDPYQARVRSNVVEMRDLYVWDDALKSRRIITQAAPDFFLFDRPSFLKTGRLPFAALTPNPMQEYFWGESEIELLSGLQEWRNKRFAQIDRMLRRQERPPKILAGFQGITDEKADGLNREGTIISSMLPGAKVQELSPQIPPDAFQEIAQLDAMFSVASGNRESLFGDLGPNVRSHAHMAAAAMLASARPKRRSLRIEGCLNDLISVALDVLRQEDDREWVGDEGAEMRFGDLAHSVKAKVDGHSASPVFAAQNQMAVSELFAAGALGPMELLEEINPPMAEVLKTRLKHKAALAAQHPQQAAEEAQKHRKAVGKLKVA
ncbi:MAG: hypothetical protein ACRD52_00725 [Candidatus Acidiferrales bacterium]